MPKRNTLSSLLARTTTTPSGCMVWTGTLARNGYAKTNYRRKSWNVHRLVKHLETGELGQCAMHSCDNRACINPQHIQWGTQKKNIRDMVQKNRCPRAKLTVNQILEIRRLGECGMLQKQIAELYGISQTNVSQILLRKTWTETKPN